MKERFTPLEWAELEKLPLIVFLAVATSSFAPAGAGAAGGKKHWWQSRSH